MWLMESDYAYSSPVRCIQLATPVNLIKTYRVTSTEEDVIAKHMVYLPYNVGDYRHSRMYMHHRTEENNFVLDQAIGLRHVNDAKGQ